jgi:pyruvate/2-oxoglutarate dehydrogenase complex dihydrolipoamide dehydrogenase (E3) component
MIERLAVRPLSDALQALADLGCEFASIDRSLRCEVTLVEKRERLLPDWDEPIGFAFSRCYAAPQARAGAIAGGLNISSDLVLVATGGKSNIEKLGLEQLGIAADPFIRIDESLRTSLLNIFAIGD